MKEHLETAPLWDAVRQKEYCPFCYLRNMIETQSVQRFLGGSVMEPDIRLKTNAAGFCSRHHRMLMAQKDYHGYALMMQTRFREAAAQAAPALKGIRGGGLFGNRGTDKAAAQLRRITSRCLVCESMSSHVDAYRDTFFRMYAKEAAFRAAFADGCGVCLDDLPDVLTDCGRKLTGERQRDFLEVLSRTVGQALETAQTDLDALCSSFHVGSEHKNNPRCKSALERAVNLLRGRTFELPE